MRSARSRACARARTCRRLRDLGHPFGGGELADELGHAPLLLLRRLARHVRARAFVRVRAWAHACVRVRVREHVRACACACGCVRARACTCACGCLHAHAGACRRARACACTRMREHARACNTMSCATLASAFVFSSSIHHALRANDRTICQTHARPPASRQRRRIHALRRTALRAQRTVLNIGPPGQNDVTVRLNFCSRACHAHARVRPRPSPHTHTHARAHAHKTHTHTHARARDRETPSRTM